MMNRKNNKTLLRVLLITLALMSFLVLSLSSSAIHSPNTKASKVNNASGSNSANPKVSAGSALISPFAMMMPAGKQPAGNLDQVRNGSATNITDPVAWVNGNAGAQTAHYHEGQSIPYRLVLTNMPLGASSATIEWDIRHSSTEAIDYITSVYRVPPAGISEAIHVCGDSQYNDVIPGCIEDLSNPANSATPIPTPPVSTTAASGKLQPITSFNALPADAKKFRIYNGTITGLTYINNADGNLGNLSASISATRLRINFTATSSTVVLSWGGHIASRGDWGFINGKPDSAGGISGSPYHTRFIELCPDGLACGGGNQDRSLSANAVAPPLECALSGPTTACQGATGVQYVVDTASLDTTATYVWDIPAATNTSGASITSSNGDPLNPPVYANVSVGNTPGSFTITAQAVNGGGSSQVCPFTTTVTANTSASDLANLTKCPGQSASFSTTASGTGGFTYAWTHDGSPLAETSNTLNIASVSSTDGGQYCVTVTGTCGDPVQKCATLTVNSDVSASTTNDEQCAGATAHLTATASGTGVGTGSFTWKKGSTTITTGIVTVDNGNNTFTSTLTLSNVQSGNAGDYTVLIDGSCLDASKTATLTVDANPTVTMAISDACLTSAKLTATAGFDTYVWTGPGIVSGQSTNQITVNATGVYKVTVTDSHSCSGSIDGQLCFALTTPAPVVVSIPNQSPDSNATARQSFKASLVAALMSIASRFAMATI
jgi:hypothetical protein